MPKNSLGHRHVAWVKARHGNAFVVPLVVVGEVAPCVGPVVLADAAGKGAEVSHAQGEAGSGD